MKKILLYLILAFSTSVRAQAATVAEVENFAKNIADQLVVEVMQAKDSVAQKRQKFESIFVHDADMDMIVNFVLGTARRQATPEQIAEFKKTFTDNFVLTWADRFTNYNGEAVIFTNVRQDKKEFWVTSEIKLPGSDKPISLLWRIREKEGRLRVVDLVAEGVSMLQNYRTEYAAVLHQNDNSIDALIQKLQDKNDSLRKSTK